MKKTQASKAEPNEDKSYGATLAKATAEMMVLFLLRKKQMYTYEMASEIEKLSNARLSFPTLYNTIYKLKSSGLVEESGKVVSDDNRVRVYFSITEKGHVQFESMVNDYFRVVGIVSEILKTEGLFHMEENK